MRRLKVAIAVITVILIPFRASAQGGGSLSGSVTYEGALPAKQELEISKDRMVCGAKAHYDERLLVGEESGLQNVVVTIANAPAGGDLKSLGSEFSLHQTGCVFKPHVLVVPVNVEVSIFNDDGILHNIHTQSEKNKPFNVSQAKYRKRIKTTFKASERVLVKCDVHGWMSGYVVVVDHPYHAITDRNGSYTITGLPAGTYQVEFWHEKLGRVQQEISVEAGASSVLDAVFSAAES